MRYLSPPFQSPSSLSALFRTPLSISFSKNFSQSELPRPVLFLSLSLSLSLSLPKKTASRVPFHFPLGYLVYIYIYIYIYIYAVIPTPYAYLSPRHPKSHSSLFPTFLFDPCRVLSDLYFFLGLPLSFPHILFLSLSHTKIFSSSLESQIINIPRSKGSFALFSKLIYVASIIQQRKKKPPIQLVLNVL